MFEWSEEHAMVRDAVRQFVDNEKVVQKLDQEPRFGRKVWGLLSLELWQQAFHDKAHSFKKRAEALT